MNGQMQMPGTWKKKRLVIDYGSTACSFVAVLGGVLP